MVELLLHKITLFDQIVYRLFAKSLLSRGRAIVF